MGDIYASHFQRSSSSYSDDYSRESLRSKLLGQASPSVSSDSLYMADNYPSNYGYQSTILNNGDSYGEMSLNYSMATHWEPPESAHPVFDDMLQFEIGSSNASYAPSMYDGESSMYDGEYDQSPTSPTFSCAVSHCSGAMSPQMSINDPATPPAGHDYGEDTMSEQADSDEVLENLLGELEPAEDGRYYCQDVQADGHACEFYADRKCMLRKHLESTLKTNICRHPDCNGMQFSSKAVLTRHEKEAHGMHAASQYFCPVPSCERHTRGFPREYNMGDHIQRVHRELDVNAFLKKSKRVRKASSGGASSSTMSSSRSGSGVRKHGGSRARRERLEKQYRSSREAIGRLVWKLPEQNTDSAAKYIQQLKAEVARLEEVNDSLQTSGSAND